MHNAGPDTATEITVTDTLPAQMTNVIASGGGVVAGGTVTWTVASLANQGDIAFTVTGFAPMDGTLTNTVSSTSVTPDPNPSNNNGSTPGQAVTTRVGGTLPAGNLPPVLEDVTVSTRATADRRRRDAGQRAGRRPGSRHHARVRRQRTASRPPARTACSSTRRPARSRGSTSSPIEGCDNVLPQLCSTGTVTVVVAPLAVRDAAHTIQNVPVSIAVLTNDIGDNVGGPHVVDAPEHGTTAIAGDEVVYAPDVDYIGSDVFTYKICSDPVTVCGQAVVAVDVLARNQPPDAQGTVVQGPADAPVSGRVWAGDPNIGQVVTFTLETPPSAGTAVVEPDGRFTFTPPPNSADAFDFRVRACDDYVVPACDVVDVTAAISPVAHPDAATTVAEVPVTFDVVANDRGGVGAPTLVSPAPTNGTVTLGADGQATYTPNAGFTGLDTFAYRVCAAAEPVLCASGTATVFVDPAPLPPVVVEPADLTTTATVPVVADLTFNHAAPDLAFTVSSDPAHGSASIDANGRVTYTPTGQFTGRDQFTVQACSHARAGELRDGGRHGHGAAGRG